MAKKQTGPKVIAEAITLDELRVKTGILDPTIQTMLDRYGYGDEIGEDYKGDSAVPVETASEFLGRYEEAKTVKSARWQAYQAYLQERRAKLQQKRREKAEKQREAVEARQKKWADETRKNAARKQAAIDAAAQPEEAQPLSFDEWEKKHG